MKRGRRTRFSMESRQLMASDLDDQVVDAKPLSLPDLGIVTVAESISANEPHPESFTLVNAKSKWFVLPLEQESHGPAEAARGSQAYSNDGNVVYTNEEVNHDSTPNETGGAIRNATGSGPKNELTGSSRRLIDVHYQGEVLLWRPAYNFTPRLLDKHGSVVSYDDAHKGPAVGHRESGPIPAFNTLDQQVLRRFLGMST